MKLPMTLEDRPVIQVDVVLRGTRTSEGVWELVRADGALPEAVAVELRLSAPQQRFALPSELRDLPGLEEIGPT